MAAGTALEGAIASYLDSDGTMTLSGTVDAGMIDETNARPATLESGVWSGFWGEPMMGDMTTGSFTGTFTGTPRTSM